MFKQLAVPVYSFVSNASRSLYWKRNGIYIAPGSWVATDVIIGRYTRVNHASHIGSCSIGSFVACGGRLVVRSSNHYTCYANMQDWAQKKIINSELPVSGKVKERVEIKSASWIGDSVIILPGGSVGFGAVVGAGSIVTRPIPDFAVAVGCPARVIKYRFPSHCIQFFLETRWWDWPSSKIHNNRSFFEIDFTTLSPSDLLSLQNLIK